MSNHNQYTLDRLPKARRSTALASTAASSAKADGELDSSNSSKPAQQPRRENTGDRTGCMSAHTVFVLSKDNQPLTPTTPCRARKLIKGGQAIGIWSKFNTFGIQMLVDTRHEVPQGVLGADYGTKFEGYSVVIDTENVLNIKLDLPDKKQVRKKLTERRILRRARRHRKLRRRPCRSDNRSRKGFIAPSQLMIVQSRLKILGELVRIYPITIAATEDVCFNHLKHRWGASFSTVEVGKARLRVFFTDNHINLTEYKGFETQLFRKSYGYKKINDKSADKFEAHCCDSLALACAVGPGERVEPGKLIVVDDTYRPVRRKLHYTQPKSGGIRGKNSTGHVLGYRKGLLIGTPNSVGILCGALNGRFRYYDKTGKRNTTKIINWVSSQYHVKEVGASSVA